MNLESEELNMEKIPEWIYAPTNFSPELEKTFAAVEKALGFKLFIWQKTFIAKMCIRDRFKPEIVLLVPLVIESIYGKLRDAGNLMPKKMVAKAAFGGNLKTICSGGAYLDPDYVERFKEYGITILQGYGMTECSPVILSLIHI